MVFRFEDREQGASDLAIEFRPALDGQGAFREPGRRKLDVLTRQLRDQSLQAWVVPNYHHQLRCPCVLADHPKNRGRVGEVERIEKIDGLLELGALGEELDGLSRACRSRAKHAVGD